MKLTKWVTWSTHWSERWFTCGADRLALRAPDLVRFREMEIQLPWRELAHCSFCWLGQCAKLELLRMFAI